eukprot:GFUD01029298.1.p1 GENE.GFUD01029298.1~~GFUD01029298.1.p1  ORF type:complete len:533 (-),score=113.68 GFUD01029298.1:42-1544(-)
MGSFGGSEGMKDVILKRRHVLDVFKDHYHMFPSEKIYGIYSIMKPTLVIKDPEIVRQIFVKDFNSFTDRDPEKRLSKTFGEKREADGYWKHQLTSLSGNKWKDVRSTFSPVFTSGKMKMMLKFIEEISKKLVNEFETKASDNVNVELKEVFGKFSMDAIASCAFGVDAESFGNKDSPFVENAAKIFTFSLIDGLRIIALHLIPGLDKIYEMFNINVMHPKETIFFVDVIRKTIKHRRETKIRRNDLIDLMLDAMLEDSNKENGENETLDQYEKDMQIDHVSGIKEIDEKTIVSTAMVFMAAGYDTTAMTLAFAAHELTKKPQIQKKLQQEIDEAYLEADGGTPDYNTIQNLPYLDQVIHETLRMHPVFNMTRTCVVPEYKVPGTDYIIKKDQRININVSGIHSDPQYYPNPKEFNPENFSKEAKTMRSPYAFLGFGQGPRACIGMRFALLEAKVGLAAVLRKFSFERCEKTVDEPELDPTSTLGYVKDGLWAKVKQRYIK